ncbi:hypothetical protein [Hyphomonas sp.]|uniref:hypothetical protein n=1 Tax=Hyphomonas sp. TaxID=87 RepID=UPI0025BE76DC|nr:hypothetical protein [Hyphomonas sp.]MBI1401148.1 hypothetical protein [Hyphomonas sp.]
MKSNRLLPSALLIAVQVIDVLVHFLVDQTEPMRIASNTIVLLAALWSLSGAAHSRAAIALAGTAYLGLNAFFLFQNGLINPATNAMRIPLFGFVGASLLLIAWLEKRIRTR